MLGSLILSIVMVVSLKLRILGPLILDVSAPAVMLPIVRVVTSLLLLKIAVDWGHVIDATRDVIDARTSG